MSMSHHEENKSPARARQAATSERYLAFLLGKEQYAIPLLQVKEVIEMSEPMPIPQTPKYFMGIINLRGQVISVLDLKAKLLLPKTDQGPKTAIIILDLEPQLLLGVIVDRINSVLAFPQEDISVAPSNLSVNKQQYLTGVARRDDNKMTLILDIRSALDIQEIQALNQTILKDVG
jgi:purine-binding chemotaxis protein CheW